MTHTTPLTAALLLALPLAGCIENEEEIEVRPDGAVEVLVRAHGDPLDLAEGYPVPLHGAWGPGGGDTSLWLARVGPETGGPRAHARALETDWRAETGRGDDELTLEARARFASVADWPRFLAPDTDPYRAAYGERSASLRVERRGRFTVYTFERTFHGRARDGYDLIHTLAARTHQWPEELSERIERDLALSPADVAFLTPELREVFVRVYGNLADDALDPEADAALTPSFAARAGRAARARVGALLSGQRVTRMLHEMRGLEAAGEDDAGPLLALEQEARAALRAALEEELVAAALPDAVRYTVLGRLEFGFTAADHTCDLSDESYRVTVRMPGTILSGNYDALEDEVASWKFDADALDHGDRVLRVVSVVE